MSLQPENALDGWREWSAGLHSKPVIVRALNGGRSNRSFLLDTDIGKLVLRINGASSLLPGTSRSNEIRIWQAASQQGIAPPLVFVDPENRYLVSVCIHDDLPSQAQTNTACVEQAFNLLAACHRLDVKTSSINYPGHIEHYWQIIESKNQPPNPGLVKQRKPMQSALETLITSETPTGLCHHDPVKANFVGTPERLYLIDWEYAASGLQIMDYAALITEWELDDSTVLQRTGFGPGLLANAKALYRYLCSLWEGATA